MARRKTCPKMVLHGPFVVVKWPRHARTTIFRMPFKPDEMIQELTVMDTHDTLLLDEQLNHLICANFGLDRQDYLEHLFQLRRSEVVMSPDYDD